MPSVEPRAWGELGAWGWNGRIDGVGQCFILVWFNYSLRVRDKCCRRSGIVDDGSEGSLFLDLSFFFFHFHFRFRFRFF